MQPHQTPVLMRCVRGLPSNLCGPDEIQSCHLCIRIKNGTYEIKGKEEKCYSGKFAVEKSARLYMFLSLVQQVKESGTMKIKEWKGCIGKFGSDRNFGADLCREERTKGKD